MATSNEIEAAAKAINDLYVKTTDETWQRYRTPEAWKQFREHAAYALTAAEKERAKDPMNLPFNIRDGETLLQAWKRAVDEAKAVDEQTGAKT